MNRRDRMIVGRLRPATRRLRFHRPGEDRGSVTVELALAVPLSLLLFFLVLGAFHLGRAAIDVHAAASAAARAASIARDHPDTAAKQSAEATLADRCASFTVDPGPTQVQRGGQVTVRVSCTVTTHGLLGLGLPGQITLTAQASSPVDVYRSVP
jgi:Flp pilus assembly protein TadG